MLVGSESIKYSNLIDKTLKTISIRHAGLFSIEPLDKMCCVSVYTQFNTYRSEKNTKQGFDLFYLTFILSGAPAKIVYSRVIIYGFY